MKELKQEEPAEGREKWSSEQSEERGRAGPRAGQAPASGSRRRPLGGAARKGGRGGERNGADAPEGASLAVSEGANPSEAEGRTELARSRKITNERAI